MCLLKNFMNNDDNKQHVYFYKEKKNYELEMPNIIDVSILLCDFFSCATHSINKNRIKFELKIN